MIRSRSALLLDTCALIWLAAGRQLSETARDAVRSAAAADELLVSAVSAWEIGLLARPGRRQQLFQPDAERWFANLVARARLKEAPLTCAISLASSNLPGQLHGDPADRLLIATARAHDVPLLTSDRNILAYAEQGHVRVIPC